MKWFQVFRLNRGLEGVWFVVAIVVVSSSLRNSLDNVAGKAGGLQDAEMHLESLIQANYKRQAKRVVWLPGVVINQGFAATRLGKAAGNVDHSTVVEGK